MLAFLAVAFMPSSYLSVKFCRLHLNYSSHLLEDIFLTHWTWENHPSINSILDSFSCHRYSCKIFIKHSCCPSDFCLFLPYLDLYSFFFLLLWFPSSEAYKWIHYPFHCDTIFLLPFFSQFWILYAFWIFFSVIMNVHQCSVHTLFFLFL